MLALPDLEQAKSAVLSSLTSRSGQRSYDHAIREFVGWYCSEPRLAFNRTVVLRYRIHLEQRQYAPATINHAMLAMVIGCGLRRGELLALTLESVQQREEHWVIADLVGKGGHVRTVPIPLWVKTAVDAWTTVATITEGPVFRAFNKAGWIWGDGMSPKAGGEPEQIQFLLGHVSVQTTERYLGCKQKLRCAVNDRLGIEPDAVA